MRRLTDASETVVCPVCKKVFRYYTGTWISATPEVTYCSKRCALHDLETCTHSDGSNREQDTR